eukprot:6193142-Pleurochrysis_carterae.AAC.1
MQRFSEYKQIKLLQEEVVIHASRYSQPNAPCPAEPEGGCTAHRSASEEGKHQRGQQLRRLGSDAALATAALLSILCAEFI